MTVDGEKYGSYTIGEYITYTNASLDGRVDSNTLQRLKDEGASEKTIDLFIPLCVPLCELACK